MTSGYKGQDRSLSAASLDLVFAFLALGLASLALGFAFLALG